MSEKKGMTTRSKIKFVKGFMPSGEILPINSNPKGKFKKIIKFPKIIVK